MIALSDYLKIKTELKEQLLLFVTELFFDYGYNLKSPPIY